MMSERQWERRAPIDVAQARIAHSRRQLSTKSVLVSWL